MRFWNPTPKMMCENCGRDFPNHLVSIFVHNADDKLLCPICALSLRNQIHGLPEGTPFQGEVAQEMYEEAVRYIRAPRVDLSEDGSEVGPFGWG